MFLNCGVGEDSWESLGLQGDPTSPFWRRSVLGVLWKEWCWSWNSNTLATSCKELIHWKRLWYWEGLGAGGEGDDRGWDSWMASPIRCTKVWVNSRSWWWTGKPGVLQLRGSQRVGHDWATELNWADTKTTHRHSQYLSAENKDGTQSQSSKKEPKPSDSRQELDLRYVWKANGRVFNNRCGTCAHGLGTSYLWRAKKACRTCPYTQCKVATP